MQTRGLTKVSSATSADAVRQQTARILASPLFSRSQTLSRFLEFVVEQTLAGKGDELKEYRLGVDVLGRGAEFDPRIDPVVRIQAAKLRSRLAEYYSDEGRNDTLVISIQKGGYVPSFTNRQKSVSKPNEVPSEKPGVQAIAVLPFVNISANPENEHFSDGLTEEVINVLTRVPGLQVVSRTSVFSFKNTCVDIREIGAQLNVQTVLEGSVRRIGNQLRVMVQWIDVSTGFHVRSRAYLRELDDPFGVQDDLAQAVVSEMMPHSSGRPFLASRSHSAPVAPMFPEARLDNVLAMVS